MTATATRARTGYSHGTWPTASPNSAPMTGTERNDVYAECASAVLQPSIPHRLRPAIAATQYVTMKAIPSVHSRCNAINGSNKSQSHELPGIVARVSVIAHVYRALKVSGPAHPDTHLR